MTAVWLYETDGRRFAYVCVDTPMPPAVTYGGRTFTWSQNYRGYVVLAMPTPCPILQEVPKEEWPQ